MKQVSVLFLMLVACNRHGHSGVIQIAGFETQVNSFLVDAKAVGQDIEISDLVIEFGDQFANSLAAAQCDYGSETNSPTITVRKSYWDIITDTERQQLLYHELGHCILLRKNHRDARDFNGMPISIMNSCSCNFHPNQVLQYYSDHRSDYVVELFTQH